MAHKIRVGLFRRKVTKFKNMACYHADWLIYRSIADKMRYTMAEMLHHVITVYLKCTKENHERQIESLENQRVTLAVELKKYRDKFGVIKK